MYNGLNRRKHQRKVNKLVRQLNNNIKNDWAWLGRFEMRQVHSDFIIFSDKSGAYLSCYFEIIDKLSAQRKLVKIEESPFMEYDLWRSMNDFITEALRVSVPKRGEEVPDFRNISIKSCSLKWWRNNGGRVCTLLQ